MEKVKMVYHYIDKLKNRRTWRWGFHPPRVDYAKCIDVAVKITNQLNTTHPHPAQHEQIGTISLLRRCFFTQKLKKRSTIKLSRDAQRPIPLSLAIYDLALTAGFSNKILLTVKVPIFDLIGTHFGHQTGFVIDIEKDLC